jgi:two-component system response regulator RegX3
MARTPATVLLVDGDEIRSRAVEATFVRDNFDVRVVHGGHEAPAALAATRAELAIINAPLPDGSAVDACRELRRRSDVPIMMTARQASEIDVIVALEVGADEFVVNPGARELVARARAMLRRSQRERAEASEPNLEVGEVLIDRQRHQVLVSGVHVAMPLKEFGLLEAFLENPGRVLTRSRLIERVWGPHYFGDTKTLDVHIRRLRFKVERDPSSPRLITTVRGVGYRYEPAHAAELAPAV